MVNLTTNYDFNLPEVNSATDEDLWGGYLNENWNSLDSKLKTRTDAYNFADFELQRASFIDTQETAYDAGSISGAVALDYTNGHYQYATVTGNITSLTISNFPASGKNGFMSLELTQDGTGGRTIALSSAYKTPESGGIALSTGAGDVDIFRFETRDAGTTIYTFANYNMS